MTPSATLPRRSGPIRADTAGGSRRPPTKRRESTSASFAASDVPSATSPACRASDSTAPMLGPTNGSTCAGDTNKLDNVGLADDRYRAASPSSWAAVSSSASRAARRPLSMARAPAVMSPWTETTPSAAPTGMGEPRHHDRQHSSDHDHGGETVEPNGLGPQQGDASQAGDQRPPGATASVPHHRPEGDADGYGRARDRPAVEREDRGRAGGEEPRPAAGPPPPQSDPRPPRRG